MIHGEKPSHQLRRVTIRYGSRFYSPTTGRWITKDVVDRTLAKNHKYSYCHNDPVNFTDRTGYADWWVEPTGGALLGFGGALIAIGVCRGIGQLIFAGIIIGATGLGLLLWAAFTADEPYEEVKEYLGPSFKRKQEETEEFDQIEEELNPN